MSMGPAVQRQNWLCLRGGAVRDVLKEITGQQCEELHTQRDAGVVISLSRQSG